jgi:hypothetical protein
VLSGIWLVAGNIDAVGDIELTGKLISLGPGTPVLRSGNADELVGQGNINPAGLLRINRCGCYGHAPTASPTRRPSRAPTHAPTANPGSDPVAGIVASLVGAAALFVAVACLFVWPAYRRRRRKPDKRKLI